MKKAWVYISVFLAGAIAGLIAGFKMAPEKIKYYVRRLKIKRSPGGQITVNTDTSGSSDGVVLKGRDKRKMDRRAKRAARKIDRVDKSN